MKAKTVIGIGYERRSIQNFIDILHGYQVAKLLDIRENPFSRRSEFAKSALSRSLDLAGITYQHLRIAGNPYHREKADLVTCLRRYQEHVATHPNIIAAVANALIEPATAVLCYERLHEHCHRSILLDALQAYDPTIVIVKAGQPCREFGSADESLFGAKLDLK